MNSLFKPYLPVDREGFVTIANPNDILMKEYALTNLIRCVKKAEMRSEERRNEEVIVVIDDEDDSFSNHDGSSAAYSHHDDMSNDLDWYSASSQMGNQSSHSQNMIETVSIDSPPPTDEHNKKSSSLSSLDSCDLNLDTSSSLVADDRNGESAQHLDVALEKQPSEVPSTSEAKATDVNGEKDGNLSSLDESMFNRLVNDINSTQVSIPGNGSASSDIKITENGESSETAAVTKSMEMIQTEVVVANDKLDKENGISTHEPVPCSSNGDSTLTTLSDEHQSDTTNETPSTVPQNHIDLKSHAEGESDKNCDSILSSDSPLKNHEETLKTINEVVSNDLKNREQPHKECSTSNGIQTEEASSSRVNTASSPIPQTNDVEMESNGENGNIEATQANLSTDFVPAAESTASVINETPLLSESVQDVLFNDLWSNGPTAASPKPEEITSPRLSTDSSPITFLANGVYPICRTYSRLPRRMVVTKTISTQTSRYSLSRGPSPVTTIEENTSSNRDRYLLTDRDDDEVFLRDIFNTTELHPVRSGGSPRMGSPMYSYSTPSASTPIASTPIASTSIETPNVTEHVQSLASVNTSGIGSAEVVVKRKRGRPRKYPLPEPGTTPIVPKTPKPPRQPRKPRQPKPPKDPNEEEVVFEKRVLRERKPKQLPPEPEPIAKAKPTEVVTAKPKRSRRRNTIKMTIDAIFNTKSPRSRAMQARRISQIFGIPMIDSQRIATILKRINYNKSSDNSRTINSDSNLNESSMLQSFTNRSNGQMVNSMANDTTAATANEISGSQSAPSTILARKTYIKPNISFNSISSALRRISFSARRMSFHTRRISFSATKRPNRTTSPRKTHAVQKYSIIDSFDTAKKRGRPKKGTKDSTPRKKPGRKSKTDQLKAIASATNPFVSIVDIGDKVKHDGTIELVDLTNDIHPIELDTTNEMNTQFANIRTALSSTQHTIHNASEPTNATLPIIKRRSFRSNDTETDFTNELTTDPESTVEDTDDSHTRKSKRSRKRPKILDL